ncbi:rubrerythrin family protein [Desulfoscipio geothermicus]|uniref:Rubrerythrin n=1 Tax=Desulfoscipio geothermicus DSM 3669 TaxID=1121426 RepID=A0A1I6DP60_9FIRM|nr:rubrerythrin family protein [Desulfoscipio geothermicus]SFR07181.1 Rubrerythrin [Desulfoscipio geothermicus DSM 3669]
MSQKTQENLMAAFAGESQANRKYLAFAQKADKEGKAKTARLFRAVAEAETIHALKHLETASKVGSTMDNVKEAIEGETYEFSNMYPEFIEKAKEEGEAKATKSFELANEAEKVHADLYKKALAALEAGGDMQAESFHLCPVCGYVALDQAPERCPICNAPAKTFKPY